MVAFSLADVGTALGRRVVGVEVVERFVASAAEVARLRIRCADRDELSVIGNYATGAGAVGARREVQFFEELAPRWDHPAPQIAGRNRRTRLPRGAGRTTTADLTSDRQELSEVTNRIDQARLDKLLVEHDAFKVDV